MLLTFMHAIIIFENEIECAKIPITRNYKHENQNLISWPPIENLQFSRMMHQEVSEVVNFLTARFIALCGKLSSVECENNKQQISISLTAELIRVRHKDQQFWNGNKWVSICEIFQPSNFKIIFACFWVNWVWAAWTSLKSEICGYYMKNCESNSHLIKFV